MPKCGAILILALALGFAPTPPAASAHYHIYWPQVAGCFGKPGEAVTWHCFWGHPFDMIVSDTPGAKFFLRTPEGKKEPVAIQEIALKDQESGKDRKALAVTCKPAKPGDYYLCLEAPAVFIPEEKVFWQDYAKSPWHVQEEKGWDEPVGLEVEIVPLTRPYGWPAGSVFKARALHKKKPLKLARVEVEKFNAQFAPRDQLPKDRHGQENTPLITRVLKTDAQGYLIFSLDSPGWWVVAVSTEDGEKKREGKAYPVEKRGCLWIYVEEPPVGKR